ncbi:hypothetical protein BDZ97DRAFT_1781657 [Flammula alnicola]|nr:hypothetical protein BDZ97DRAFT_1781657 [Flammula alnicola]
MVHKCKRDGENSSIPYVKYVQPNNVVLRKSRRHDATQSLHRSTFSVVATGPKSPPLVVLISSSFIRKKSSLKMLIENVWTYDDHERLLARPSLFPIPLPCQTLVPLKLDVNISVNNEKKTVSRIQAVPSELVRDQAKPPVHEQKPKPTRQSKPVEPRTRIAHVQATSAV